MAEDLLRKRIQKRASDLSLKHSNLILEYCTGLGKTRSLLQCIDISPSTKKWLILVPEINLIQNFKLDIIKHGYEHLIDNKIYDIVCYQSLDKYQGASFNIGLDEGHHVSELRLKYLETIDSDQRILLSATLPLEVKDRLNSLGTWYIDHISLQQGIDLGILPEPELYVKFIELKTNDPKYSWKFGKKVVTLTSQDYYNQLEKQVKYWQYKYESEGKPYMKKKWLLAANDRKRWLGEFKTQAMQDLLDKNNDRLICFCSSLDQAKRLGGEQSVHSENMSRENQNIITDFNNSKTNRLFSCSMLREGMNLTNIDSGYIVQLPGNTKEVVQSVGRILRGVAPKIYITVVKGTKDEDYLRKTLGLFNKTYQEVN